MPDTQTLRKRNLRALIKQWEGPTVLAKKLRYSGPSYLSQMIKPIEQGGKPITEKTARFIESELGLSPLWMDTDHAAKTGQYPRLDSALIARVMLSVGTALQDAGAKLPSTSPRMLVLVELAYEHAAEHGEVDDGYVVRLVKLIKE